ncbi:hypothetical protein GpartN1_g2401.t1 [Galdieria partita]|uniref:GATA-type domain-containing protein n=1 Tax=Galdieria partita TaxID=83374 RepID=A0A9C7PU96_9RHOD|nr:hypothetical protein GpartN1_g2401.t1 [Galdieria partita]
MIEHLRCVVCGVTDTPLWRSGPKGRKTLCNACGVRWKKGKLYIDGKQASPPIATRLIMKTTQKRGMDNRVTGLGSPIQSHYFSYQNFSVTEEESKTSKYEAFLKTPTAAAIAYAATNSGRNRFHNRVVMAKEEIEESKQSVKEQGAQKRSCSTVDRNQATVDKERIRWYLSGLYSESDEELEASPVLIELEADSLPPNGGERGDLFGEESIFHCRGKPNKRNSFSKKDASRPLHKWRKDSKSMRQQTEYKFGLLLDAAKAVGMGV